MIGCIVQARMNSSRYPEKIMLKIKNRPILDFVINQLNFSKKINKLIIATTTKKFDDVIEVTKKLENHGILLNLGRSLL